MQKSRSSWLIHFRRCHYREWRGLWGTCWRGHFLWCQRVQKRWWFGWRAQQQIMHAGKKAPFPSWRVAVFTWHGLLIQAVANWCRQSHAADPRSYITEVLPVQQSVARNGPYEMKKVKYGPWTDGDTAKIRCMTLLILPKRYTIPAVSRNYLILQWTANMQML